MHAPCNQRQRPRRLRCAARDEQTVRAVARAPRVLATGGAGFLGSHLGERLLAEGADVLCVDKPDVLCVDKPTDDPRQRPPGHHAGWRVA